MAVQNIKLYEFMRDKECHIFRDKLHIECYVIVNFCELKDFVEIVGHYAFDEGGLDVKMFDRYVSICLSGIFESEEEFMYEYRKCFEESEFEEFEQELLKEFQDNQ